MFVEYAGVLAAVSILAIGVAGGFSKSLATLPVTHAAALQQVAVAAKAKRVPVAEAKASYRESPYAKPSLKVLYTLGWIGGRSNLAACGLTLLAEDTARARALEEIRGDPKVVAALKKRGISARVAARTLVEGVVSACR
ncbi:MAG: hypothetical protein KatS3mg012_0214 [Gaiellaceae bacterium]|nr:MAG: hypothetical protein KatS3mg012_0214 [Gaiellaceae bacterium]